MKNKLKLLPLAAAVLFAPAYAEEKNYFGASVGRVITDIKAACADAIDAGFASAKCETGGLGIRGFGGRQFNKYLALEIGYTHAPKATEIRATANNGTNIDFELSYSAFDAGLVARYPFNDTFAVSAHVGSAFWEQEFEATGPGISESVSDDGTDLFYGVGVESTFAKSFSVRGEWKRVAADEDVDYFSLSAAYRF